MEQKESTQPLAIPLPNISSKDRSSAKPWILLSPGIWELHLNGPSSSHKSVLQFWEPGAVSPTKDIVTHEYIEEVMTIEGSLRDSTLGEEWGMGAYAYRYVRMKHGLYVAGNEGCYQFVKCIPSEEAKN